MGFIIFFIPSQVRPKSVRCPKSVRPLEGQWNAASSVASAAIAPRWAYSVGAPARSARSQAGKRCYPDILAGWFTMKNPMKMDDMRR